MRKPLWMAIGLISVFIVAGAASLAAAPQSKPGTKPTKNELVSAEHYLKKLEDRAERMKGQNFKMGYEEQEALKRIKALKEKYPDDPDVQALFQRASKSVMTSKGDFLEVTPDMLKYRQAKATLANLFAKEAETQWQAFQKKIAASGNPIAKPFPPPTPREENIGTMKGRTIVLPDFIYPNNQFMETSGEYVFVGSRTRGFYYVQINMPSWLGVYEAVKRYRRFVNSDLPENTPWTMIGRITDIALLVPEAEKKKIGGAFWGWVVEPQAIRVEGKTFAVADADLETGGRFAGEERMDEIKRPLYSVTSIPANVTPERLLEIYCAAIKEQNIKLFQDCIDPELQTTPRAKSRVMYHWDWHQIRFATLYIHATVDKVTTYVSKGYDPNNNLESFFLTDAQKNQVKKISEPRVERAVVWTKAWDERGRQYGSPKPHALIRRDGGRWYIRDFAAQF